MKKIKKQYKILGKFNGQFLILKVLKLDKNKANN